MTMYPTIGDQQYLGHDSYHSYLINIRMEYIYWMRPAIRPALVRKGWTYPGTTQVTPVTPFGHRGHQVDARHPHLQWKRAVTFAEPCETTTCSKTKKGHFYGIRSHHYHQYIMIIPYYTSFLIRWGHFSWHLVEKKKPAWLCLWPWTASPAPGQIRCARRPATCSKNCVYVCIYMYKYSIIRTWYIYIYM